MKAAYKNIASMLFDLGYIFPGGCFSTAVRD